MRIGVASLMQETNTFSLRACGWDDFAVFVGDDVRARVEGTNSELAGAIATIEAAGATAVPLVHAWAFPSGRVDDAAYERLVALLSERTEAAGLDALVLALHGSMVTGTRFDPDAELIETARELLPRGAPIGVSLDLHANVTRRMVAAADVISGYHTDPHVDMGATGARVARHVIATLEGRLVPAAALEKRPMIIPAESMNTSRGPLADIRRAADDLTTGDVVDISLFPVQPWLDVPELGFGVLVTANGDEELARTLASELAGRVWRSRRAFTVPRLLEPEAAIRAAAASPSRPFVVAESADAPTAGAAGDSPAMLGPLARASDLSSVVPVVDAPAVAACVEAGTGARVTLDVGASLDTRWSEPFRLGGRVIATGGGTYRLEGASFTGMEVSMGRFAVVSAPPLTVLLSERPAWTSDPATYAHAGIDLTRTDVLVVRSCSDFLANFPVSAADAVTLDVPGPASPRLDRLEFRNTGRQPWPIDHDDGDR